MEMRQLIMFCAVAEEGSFTAAADRVNTVQSNVTMRMKELETELNQQMFIRQRSGVLLTSAGKTFLGYARRILQLTDESRRALSDTGEPSGLLRLGSMETTAAVRLPNVLKTYRKKYPQVQMSLLTGTTSELIKAVETYQIDGAFVGGYHQNPLLEQEKISLEELVLLSSREYDSLEALIQKMPEQTVLVFRTGCFYRSTFEHWLYQFGLVPNQTMELGTLDGIISCVAAGMGITLLPKAIAEQYEAQQAIRSHPLSTDFANVTTFFIRRKDTAASPALSEFLKIAHEHFSVSKQLGPEDGETETSALTGSVAAADRTVAPAPAVPAARRTEPHP